MNATVKMETRVLLSQAVEHYQLGYVGEADIQRTLSSQYSTCFELILVNHMLFSSTEIKRYKWN